MPQFQSYYTGEFLTVLDCCVFTSEGKEKWQCHGMSVNLISRRHSERNRLQTDYEMYTTTSREWVNVIRVTHSVHFTHQLLLVLNFKTHQSEILFGHSRRHCTASHFCFSAVQIFSKTLERRNMLTCETWYEHTELGVLLKTFVRR